MVDGAWKCVAQSSAAARKVAYSAGTVREEENGGGKRK